MFKKNWFGAGVSGTVSFKFDYGIRANMDLKIFALLVIDSVGIFYACLTQNVCGSLLMVVANPEVW